MEKDEVIKTVQEYLINSPVVQVNNLRWLKQPDFVYSWIVGDLTASDSAGGLFAVQIPDRNNVFVDLVFVDITTASSGACTMDVGVAVSATTSADTLIDGVSLATIRQVSSLNDGGTNGRCVRRVAGTDYITGSVATGASSGLVGKFYIRYRSV